MNDDPDLLVDAEVQNNHLAQEAFCLFVFERHSFIHATHSYLKSGTSE